MLSLAAAIAPVTRADPPPPAWDATTRDTVVDTLDDALRRHFAHWQAVPGLDYNDAFAQYRAAASVSADRAAFSLLTRRFVASLHNGHTFFHDPEAARDDPGNLGLRLISLDGHWIVAASRRAGIAAGSEVIGIDGEPFEAFYRRQASLLSGSSDRLQRVLLSFSPELFPVRFTLRLGDGTETRVDRRDALPQAAAPSPAVEHRWLDDGVAYLKLRSFGDDAHERTAKVLLAGTYAHARSVVVDVRGNGGGSTPSALVRAMLGADRVGWQLRPPAGRVAPPAAKPVVPARYLVLADRYCGSACDDFVMPFSLSPQAVVIGETTAGSSGQPKIVRWKNGMTLWVGARRQWFPDGREFEGVGVSPDVEVPLTAADFRPGAPDRVLACARRIAASPRLRRCGPDDDDAAQAPALP